MRDFSLRKENGGLAQSISLLGLNAVGWTNGGTYQSPYCISSGFPQGEFRESTTALIQKENLLFSKGRTGMK